MTEETLGKANRLSRSIRYLEYHISEIKKAESSLEFGLSKLIYCTGSISEDLQEDFMPMNKNEFMASYLENAELNLAHLKSQLLSL